MASLDVQKINLFSTMLMASLLLGVLLHHPLPTHAFFSSSPSHHHHHTQFATLIDDDSFAASNNVDSNNLPFDVGVCNIPGVDWQRPGKVNQDSYFIDHLSVNGRDYSVVGVLDGHGRFGQEISSFASKNMPREIHNQLLSTEIADPQVIEYECKTMRKLAGFDCSEYKSTCSNTQQALVNAFNTVHFNAMLDKHVKLGRNGSTCIVCLIDNDSLECNVAYVGDFRAIVCYGNGPGPSLDHSNSNSNAAISVIASELTVDCPGKENESNPGKGT